ncbi:MAG: helicase [Thermoproteota archaeon]|nr:helicase [Thermoproteota archaeon]
MSKSGLREKELRGVFPYANFRPYQKDLISFAYSIFKGKSIGLVNSPCGTGKSISTLTSYFMARKEDESIGHLLILTRTQSQLEIYSRELREIKKHSGLSFVTAMFRNKRDMCPIAVEDERFRRISYRDFLSYCQDLRAGAFGSSCEYYDRTCSKRKPSMLTIRVIEEIKALGPMIPEEVYSLCRDEKLCPYEVTRILARTADVIVGNYNYVLVDEIRNSLLTRSEVDIEEVNCIFDEAHGLPDYAAAILSDELSTFSISRAIEEVKEYKVEDRGLFGLMRRLMARLGSEAYRRSGLEYEYVIRRRAFVRALGKRLGFSKASELLELASNIMEAGEKIRWTRGEEGKNPVSYTVRCTEFLTSWIEGDDVKRAYYCKVSVDSRGKRYARLGVRCLDPALAAASLNKLRSVILMSGTLWDMDYYVDVLGLYKERVKTLSLQSPFPPENRLLLVDRGVTTKYEMRSAEEWNKIAHHLEQLQEEVGRRIAVYFPSYSVMKAVLKEMNLGFPYLVEEKATKFSDVYGFLKENQKGIVFGVARGKISEGVDMTFEGSSMLSVVVIVGLPYPRKTPLQDALLNYFKKKFGGRAMEYGNDIPCVNALAQAAGRLLRSERDRGVIMIMDSRAIGRFQYRLPEEWQREMRGDADFNLLIDNVVTFFRD